VSDRADTGDSVASVSSGTRVVDIDGRRMLLSSLEQLLWPEEGVTKADLIDYYVAVADEILPFLARRPVSLLRWTDEPTAEFAYQKTAPPGLPSWIPTRRIRSAQATVGYAEHVLGGDRAALVYLVNLGHLSFHPWSSTADAIDRPDQLRFDLDPTEIAFREVRNAAILIRDLLAHFRIRSWVKTSGGRGLHVMVPLAPVHTFEQVIAAAEAVTRMARHREPSLFTLDMRRARRRGKILIDVHRNHRGATLVSPYSVREYTGASVSAPLEWHELERVVYPEDFHLRNIRERLRSVGDPFRSFFAEPQSLATLLDSSRARRARALAQKSRLAG
jgi:bifunctional non-homologous end joining protein LigD